MKSDEFKVYHIGMLS